MRYVYQLALLIVGAPVIAALLSVTHSPTWMTYVIGGAWGVLSGPLAIRLAGPTASVQSVTVTTGPNIDRATLAAEVEHELRKQARRRMRDMGEWGQP
jgi:hypothetical protein